MVPGMSDALVSSFVKTEPAKEAVARAPEASVTLAAKPSRFIPVSRYGLRAKLIEMLARDGADERQWRRALDCLAAWRHQQYRTRLLDLLEDYLPFGPDSDTANLVAFDAASTAKAQGEFIEGV